ncbi:MAG: molybdenum cofactor guanylyltransferase [Candidatus Bathyarchaeota archaeon]|nr:MAG: molybdenum cofactor guanylyltransferase [Candidatus Bathyarchaeota archaeon]
MGRHHSTSAIVLAGGVSRRLGRNKGLVKLAGRPLISHVLSRLKDVVDEVVIVVSSQTQKEKIGLAINGGVDIVVDEGEIQTPLVGALRGFTSVQSSYSLLLPCDTPLLSTEILSFLLEICVGKSAAIPRWPNGNIEPLHSAYNALAAAKAAERALQEQRFDMRAMISNMNYTRYVSTTALQIFDPQLTSFLNVNTQFDLKRVETAVGSQLPAPTTRC